MSKGFIVITMMGYFIKDEVNVTASGFTEVLSCTSTIGIARATLLTKKEAAAVCQNGSDRVAYYIGSKNRLTAALESNWKRYYCKLKPQWAASSWCSRNLSHTF